MWLTTCREGTNIFPSLNIQTCALCSSSSLSPSTRCLRWDQTLSPCVETSLLYVPLCRKPIRGHQIILLLIFYIKGLAIGLQSSKENMLTIFAAVMMHKAIMAFSLGLNIAQSSFSVRFFINSQDEFFPDIKIFKLHRWKLSSCPAWCSAWQVPLVWLLVSFRLSHHMPLLASPIDMGELLVNLTFPYPSVSPSQSSLAGSWQEDKWCHFADCSFSSSHF